jgi:hypothetical protein
MRRADDRPQAQTPVHVPSQPDADDFVDTDNTAVPEEKRDELDERGQRILAFERQWWRQSGAKEQAIRDTFGLSATRYYQLLNTLLDDPRALEHDSVVVNRLRRLRASRVRARR